MIESYLPVLFVFLLAAGFAITMLGLTHVVGPRIKESVKLSVYESGVDPVAPTHSRLNVRYFIIGLVFIIFDIEVVFLYPWAVVLKDFIAISGSLVFLEMVFFIGILLVGYIYIWRKGVFEWE